MSLACLCVQLAFAVVLMCLVHSWAHTSPAYADVIWLLSTARNALLIILCLVGDAAQRVASREVHSEAQSHPASVFALEQGA